MDGMNWEYNFLTANESQTNLMRECYRNQAVVHHPCIINDLSFESSIFFGGRLPKPETKRNETKS